MNIGEKYGRLTVIGFTERKNYANYWLCKCDCGKEKNIRQDAIQKGVTKSCGCLKAENCKKPIDIKGNKYNRLTVIEYAGTKIVGNNSNSLWLCKCECGNEKLVLYKDLVNNTVKSCGCLKVEKATKHGGYYDRLYKVWDSMKNRCYNDKFKFYCNYGGRGIKVCDEWKENYSAFKEWAYKNGYDENAKRFDCTIDRIDSNKDYSPDNCRWVSMKTQDRNKRSNVFLEIDGVTKCVTDWCKLYGEKRNRVYYRIRVGKPSTELFDNIKGKNIKIIHGEND